MLEQANREIEAVARRSYGKLVAFLAARTRDVPAAEDALSEAFASALQDWPAHGCPANPEAWLLTVARRKSTDVVRHRLRSEAVVHELRIMAEGVSAGQADSVIPDERLALLFACAHPSIDPGIRAPLLLQIVLGLDAAKIASAFLMSPAAMAQRLVRAKQKIREAGIPFRIPDSDELAGRLEAVLDAVYASYSESWSDAAGVDGTRRDLAEEAIFLARMIAETLMPQEPEAKGLLALMLHAEARRPARRNSHGEYVPLAQQDTRLWNTSMIEEAEALLLEASRAERIGRFQLEAALQSAHAARCRSGRANWEAVVTLYDALLQLVDSPVVAINRAVALAEVEGAAAALASIGAIACDGRVLQYQPYWAARAELLAKTGAQQEARDAYEMAIGLERDGAVRRFLQAKQSELLYGPEEVDSEGECSRSQ